MFWSVALKGWYPAEPLRGPSEPSSTKSTKIPTPFFRFHFRRPQPHCPLLQSRSRPLTPSQGITKGFTTSGFKTQVQPLSAFHESYGLEGDEDEDHDDDDEDEDEEMDDVDGETEDGTEEE